MPILCENSYGKNFYCTNFSTNDEFTCFFRSIAKFILQKRMPGLPILSDSYCRRLHPCLYRSVSSYSSVRMPVVLFPPFSAGRAPNVPNKKMYVLLYIEVSLFMSIKCAKMLKAFGNAAFGNFCLIRRGIFWEPF